MKAESLKSISVFFEKTFIVLILIISVSANVYLTFEVKNLKKALGLLQADRAEHEITLGKTVGPLEVRDQSGRVLTIKYDTELPAVLYVFSPDCVWCERNLENIKLLSETAKEKYRFVGVSITRVNSVTQEQGNEMSFPVYYNPPDSSRLEYNFRSTPSTFVISPEGKIEKLWLGAYNEKNLPDIENFFKVDLPGMTE